MVIPVQILLCLARERILATGIHNSSCVINALTIRNRLCVSRAKVKSSNLLTFKVSSYCCLPLQVDSIQPCFSEGIHYVTFAYYGSGRLFDFPLPHVSKAHLTSTLNPWGAKIFFYKR